MSVARVCPLKDVTGWGAAILLDSAHVAVEETGRGQRSWWHAVVTEEVEGVGDTLEEWMGDPSPVPRFPGQ